MQGDSYQQHDPLASQILDAYGSLMAGRSELADHLLRHAIRHMCEVVDRSEDGWLAVYGECAKAANREPHAVALLAAQEAVELVVCGYPIEVD
jgi:hypothetical protein